MGAGLFTRSLHNLRTMIKGVPRPAACCSPITIRGEKLGADAAAAAWTFSTSIPASVTALPGVGGPRRLAAVTPLQGGDA